MTLFNRFYPADLTPEIGAENVIPLTQPDDIPYPEAGSERLRGFRDGSILGLGFLRSVRDPDFQLAQTAARPGVVFVPVKNNVNNGTPGAGV